MWVIEGLLESAVGSRVGVRPSKRPGVRGDRTSGSFAGGRSGSLRAARRGHSARVCLSGSASDAGEGSSGPSSTPSSELMDFEGSLDDSPRCRSKWIEDAPIDRITGRLGCCRQRSVRSVSQSTRPRPRLSTLAPVPAQPTGWMKCRRRPARSPSRRKDSKRGPGVQIVQWPWARPMRSAARPSPARIRAARAGRSS